MVTGYIVSAENQGVVSVQVRNGISELASGNGERIDRWMISFPSADSCVDARVQMVAYNYEQHIKDAAVKTMHTRYEAIKEVSE